MEAAEELYRAAIFQSSREAELAETRDLYRRAGYALARSGEMKRPSKPWSGAGRGAWEMLWPETGRTWRGFGKRIQKPTSFTARQCRNCRAWSPRRGQELLARKALPRAI